MFRGVVNNYGGSGEWNKSRNFALRLIDSGDVTVTDVTLIRRRITPR
jgi:Mg2+/Co2+ transporter CorB